MFPTVRKLGNVFRETVACTNLKVLFMFAVYSLKTMFLVLEIFENMLETRKHCFRNKNF